MPAATISIRAPIFCAGSANARSGWCGSIPKAAWPGALAIPKCRATRPFAAWCANAPPQNSSSARYLISWRRISKRTFMAVIESAPNALSLLNSVFGLPAFRGAQEEIVRHVAGGGNCLVLMPTGGGKSLCYQLPSLLRKGCGIVVSPLIALMRDQVAGLIEAGVNAAVLNSTLSFAEASEVERRLLAGDLDLLYVAPERLL